MFSLSFDATRHVFLIKKAEQFQGDSITDAVQTVCAIVAAQEALGIGPAPPIAIVANMADKCLDDGVQSIFRTSTPHPSDSQCVALYYII